MGQGSGHRVLMGGAAQGWQGAEMGTASLSVYLGSSGAPAPGPTVTSAQTWWSLDPELWAQVSREGHSHGAGEEWPQGREAQDFPEAQRFCVRMGEVIHHN